jgi:hypothetical protein
VNPLALIPIRFYVYAAIAAAFGFVLWREHIAVRHNHELAGKLTAKAAQLDAALATAADQKEFSDVYYKRLQANRAGRADTPVRIVRIAAPARVSGPVAGTAESGREGLPDPPRRDPEEGGGTDVGPELYSLADDADDCAVQRDTLIEWIATHAAGGK